MNISKKKAIKILGEIYHIAYEATLTGALRHGAKPLTETYNKIRELSINNKWIEGELDEVLPPVTEEEMANVGIAAKLLAVMLEDEKDFKYKEAKKYDENGYEIKDETEA